MYKSEVNGKGGIRARVVADSIANGVRITTMELRYHRFIHSEFLTHRMFSRNSSSSRAIPVAKMIEQVETNPAMPIHWGKNQAGMQAKEECNNKILISNNSLTGGCNFSREEIWLDQARDASLIAELYSKAGYHKQIVNRLLEPFQFINTVVTATEWDNFFKLRDHRDAQPEIAELARCMKQAMEESDPRELKVGEWHTPYVDHSDTYVMSCYANKEDMYEAMRKASAARCARVSYLNHDKSNPSIEDDLELYNMLATRPYVDKRGTEFGEDDPVHLSPLEHGATPMQDIDEWFDPRCDAFPVGVTHFSKSEEGLEAWSGNFRGWIQNRRLLEK